MDKKMRIERLRKLQRDIQDRQYPGHMEIDRVSILHALEKRIFKLNGMRCEKGLYQALAQK